MPIEFRILGPLEVRADGRLLSLGSPKQRALLGLLLVHANETVSRDRLIEELWGEAPPATVESAVHVYLSRLRRLLEIAGAAGVLVRDASGYRLRVEPEQLDANRFERLAGEGSKALAARNADIAAGCLRQALALWRGPAFDDLQSERFAITAAARLNEQRVSSLEQRLEADLALGRHRDLVAELDTLVAEHPYRERLRAQLMLALYRSGRQAEALDAYQQARRALDELGIEPSAALQRLQKAVLRQDEALQPSREPSEPAASPEPRRSAAPPKPRRSAVSSTSRTSMLDDFGLDVTQAARDGKLDPVIGRADEIEQTIEILCRRMHNNPVLLGEPGVGKTAIVEEVARRIATGQVPERLAEKRLVALAFAAIAAASKSRGEFVERLENVVKEITQRGDIILFIDDFRNLVGGGATEGAIDAASTLKPALARGKLQTIGITTLGEYCAKMLGDPTFDRRFEPVLVHEPSAEETIEILHGLRDRYERFHHVRISDEGIVAAVELADRYIDGRFRPSKAIDLIDRASARVRLSAEAKGERTRGRPRRQLEPDVTAEHVAGVLSREMGIPVS
jgi:ATP-dependent Clp protease ATP-binding subunit ClpA/DNA-binding winged helix-turn-helix (wHTH) protein